MGNLFRSLSRRRNYQGSNGDTSVHQGSSAPQQTTPSPEKRLVSMPGATPQPEKQPQTEANTTVVEVHPATRSADVVADVTVRSPPLGLSSLQKTLEGNQNQGDTDTGHDDPLTKSGSHVIMTKPISSASTATIGSTATGSISSRSYLKKMSRQERRRIEQDIKRKRRPGKFVVSV